MVNKKKKKKKKIKNLIHISLKNKFNTITKDNDQLHNITYKKIKFKQGAKIHELKYILLEF
jgi:hypothetical protein